MTVVVFVVIIDAADVVHVVVKMSLLYLYLLLLFMLC